MKEMTLKEIQKLLGYEVKIVADKPAEVGGVVNVAGIDWIVLEKTDDAVMCLAKDLVYTDTQFDSNTPNYALSSIRKKLNGEFLKKVNKAVGDNNVADVEIDLTSLDGLDDFGKVTDKVGLLTFDMYRKYSCIIEKYPVNAWWWLSTPWSMPRRGWHSAVCSVLGGGAMSRYNCDISFGARPFCIFSSSIFDS